MKHLSVFVLALIMGLFTLNAQELAPYIAVGESETNIEQLSADITATLKRDGFMVLGNYKPLNQDHLRVIVFSRTDVRNTVVQVADRGALAAAFKIGLVERDGRVAISYTNPGYIFRAYIRDKFDQHRYVFDDFSASIRNSLNTFGSRFEPFGGTVKADKLRKYHYKVMMPYFTDPVVLNTFNSYEEGRRVIAENLALHASNLPLVYKIEYPDQQVTVYGIGLYHPEEGEPHFIPKIGEAHIAALPYEMILQGNELTMLHGKYRIALHWPDLTMGTFMKIMSTPGDIRDQLESLGDKETAGIQK